MANYVEVPREALETRLQAAGFTRVDQQGEVTYERKHDHDARLSVRVYTSVAQNAEDARGCGQDAIRIVAQFVWTRQDGETRRKNLHQAKVLRVTSVEGVLERMIQAARDGYTACNAYRREKLLK